MMVPNLLILIMMMGVVEGRGSDTPVYYFLMMMVVAMAKAAVVVTAMAVKIPDKWICNDGGVLVVAVAVITGSGGGDESVIAL